MHDLPESPEMAGGKGNPLRIQAYQGRAPQRRGAEGLARAQRPAAEEILQYQRPEIQGAGAEGPASRHDRRGADHPAGVGRDAGKAPRPGGGRFCPDGVPGGGVGRCAGQSGKMTELQ